MNGGFLYCLKCKQDISIWPILSGVKTAFRCTPTLINQIRMLCEVSYPQHIADCKQQKTLLSFFSFTKALTLKIVVCELITSSYFTSKKIDFSCSVYRHVIQMWSLSAFYHCSTARLVDHSLKYLSPWIDVTVSKITLNRGRMRTFNPILGVANGPSKTLGLAKF